MKAMEPKDLPNVFQRNLRTLRVQKRRTIRALADSLGTSDSAIVNWESGKTSPTLNTVVRIAEALGVSPEALLSDLDGTKKPTSEILETVA